MKMNTRFNCIGYSKDGFTLYFDGNSKVTMTQRGFNNPVANAFSLPQIKSCPYSTGVCRSLCYVHRLELHQPDLHARYVYNYRIINNIINSHSLYNIGLSLFSSFINEYNIKYFRWHISGDVFSKKYAMFISDVCLLVYSMGLDTEFWIYTRSFKYLQHLAPPSNNLNIILSADRDNYDSAMYYHDIYGYKIAYLADSSNIPYLPDDSIIFPTHDLRGRDMDNPLEAEWWRSITPRERRMVCPADFFGQSEYYRCGVCRKCFTGLLLKKLSSSR